MTAELPDEIKENVLLYTGCVAGAQQIDHVEKIIRRAGFQHISIRSRDESRQMIREWVPERRIEDYVVSAAIEAIKP